MRRLLNIVAVASCLTLALECWCLEYERLVNVPGVDPHLIELLRNHSISEHEFYRKLKQGYKDITNTTDRLFGEWIKNQDDEIANQFISAGTSKSKKSLRLCPELDDCREEVDNICFGQKRMKNVCRQAEGTHLIEPKLLIEQPGKGKSYWISINSNSRTIQHHFNDTKSIVIVIHGFRQSYTDVTVIHDALVDVASHDLVITLDYTYAARGPNYARAIANSELVAYFLYRFIRKSISALSLTGGNIYLVSFSLGTQVAHFTAQYLAEDQILLGRITGLDPSAVLTKGVRLSHQDAEFVDVIHTSADFSDQKGMFSYLMGKVGIRSSMGHVDFYPNGGGFQPFCRNMIRNMNIACHHLMAIKYFVSSIHSCRYHSYPCQTVPNPDAFYDKQCQIPHDLTLWSRMGYHAHLRKKESMWTSQLLYTDYEQPFCEISNPCATILSCSRSRFFWPE